MADLHSSDEGAAKRELDAESEPETGAMQARWTALTAAATKRKYLARQ